MLTYKKVKDKYMPNDRYTTLHSYGLKYLTQEQLEEIREKHSYEKVNVIEFKNKEISESHFDLSNDGKLWRAQLLHPQTKEPIGKQIFSHRYRSLLEMLITEQQAIIADLNNKIASTGSAMYTISPELKIEEQK